MNPVPSASPRSVALSEEMILVYVLRQSGTRGRLVSGRVQRSDSGGLDVFDAAGRYFEYLSGDRIRSWCVFGPDGKPVEGWSEIRQEDVSKIVRATN